MHIQQATEPTTGSLLIKTFESEAAPSHEIFKADKEELWWQSEKELWLGLGKTPKLPALLKIFRSIFHKRKDRWPIDITLDARGRTPDWIEMAVNGILLGGYDIQLYKSSPKPLSDFFGENGRLNIWMDEVSVSVENVISLALKTGSVQIRIMDLMNAPGNFKTPSVLADWAEKSGTANGFKVEIIDKKGLEEKGLHALLSVSKGSAEPPFLIVTEYTPEHYTKTVALVGKGVTFDTGGISIKQSANMHLMKSDMGGAAAVLGTVELVAQLGLPIRVIGVVPTTENCIDGESTKPGDVISSYAGKTIEVIDTDAEGRLILADALTYAIRNYNPDTVIDLATLTGSVIQTLGYEAAGLFTANEQLALEINDAAEETGEKVWRLPIWDEYKEEINSDIADVKNYHGKPLAGAIVAAKFLEVFTEEHPRWAHLDIAGVAFGDTQFVPGRAGTAYGIRLLRTYLSKLSEA